MPRKSKIIAVPIDEPLVETVVEPIPEVKTDAEEMSTVINEIKAVDNLVEETNNESPVTELDNKPVVKPKAKAKRAPKTKEPELQAEVTNVSNSLDESTVEISMPEEMPKAVENNKVSCPDCGKEMSAKTLKYSHAPNCVTKKKQANILSAPASTPVSTPLPDPTPVITEEIIEDLVQQRLNNVRQQRIARKQAMIDKLVSNAF